MEQEENKRKLVAAAQNLLEKSDSPERITSRAIAEEAGVNAAMINYYFRSKDNLLTEAVGEIISFSAEQLKSPDKTKSPKERLRAALWEICEVVVRFRKFSKLFVPQILLNGKIEAPFYLLPDIREHFHGEKDEMECRVIAYEMISFLQLVFYRADEFCKYSGMDLMKQDDRKRLFDLQLDYFLPND